MSVDARTPATFTAESPWIRRAVRPSARLRLFCVPYAGAGASVFRGWPAALPDDVEVVAVQLPGREDRSREPVPADLDALVRTLTVALRPYTALPFAFYGHCAGALLAYEVARGLGARFGAWPVSFVAGAQEGPRFGVAGVPPSTVDDERFLAAVRARGGVPDAVLARPDLLAFLLPLLRGDFALWDGYEHRPGPLLPCPVTVLRGRQDAFVGAEEAGAWRDHTTAACTVRDVDGDHYFVNDTSDETTRVLADVLLS